MYTKSGSLVLLAALAAGLAVLAGCGGGGGSSAPAGGTVGGPVNGNGVGGVTSSASTLEYPRSAALVAIFAQTVR